MLVSDGLLHDVNILDLFGAGPGSFYVMDRAYVDFERLFTINQAGALFVTRAKKLPKFKRISSQSVDKSIRLIFDQEIVLTVFYSRKGCPRTMRRVRLKDPETGKTLVFLTSNFEITAKTICNLYRSRWQVELFFKWIKQHLRINQFFGRSENAVKCQISIAVATCLLVAVGRLPNADHARRKRPADPAAGRLLPAKADSACRAGNCRGHGPLPSASLSAPRR